jgi:ubiquinone/menaquinone biosynthesis C-methylase UbiE
MIKPICPFCKLNLQFEKAKVNCNQCHVEFPIIDGIIRFADIDDFYEGKFGAQKERVSNAEKLARKIYKRIALSVDSLRREHESLYKNLAVNAAVKVLDIGCGGGKSHLKPSSKYHLTGMDLSLASLMNAKQIYDEVYCASALSMPFADSTFDCVCSFDVIGHVPNDIKDKLLSEIYRVLKPGGVTFHYIEVDSPKGYNDWAKQHTALYRKYFIDLEGHIGLEYYKDAMSRFDKNGFQIIKYKGIGKWFLPPGEFQKRFNNEYREKSRVVKAFAILDSLIVSNAIGKALFGVMLKPFSLLLEPLISDDYSGLLFVAYKKA